MDETIFIKKTTLYLLNLEGTGPVQQYVHIVLFGHASACGWIMVIDW